MRNTVLIGFALAMTAGFILLNDYQHEMLTQGMEPPAKAAVVDLVALAETLRTVETVVVPTTRESHEAFLRAVEENPGAKVWELGAASRDLPYEIAIPDGANHFRTVPALIVLTDPDYLAPEHAFRTDSPLWVLEYVRDHPELDYLVLNPRHESNQGDVEAIVLGPEQIEALIDRLASFPGPPS